MKRHHILIETVIFFLIFFSQILSAILAVSASKDGVAPVNIFTEWNFPWYHLISSAFCVVVLLIFYEKSSKRTLIIYPVLITYGMMFATSLLCNALSIWINAAPANANVTVTKPEGVLAWFFCILTFIFSAFNEEVIYRFYMADKLNQILSVKIHAKILRWICELIALLCFAFAHLYLGWIAVLNAAIAHVFLRRCYLKSGRLWQCVVAHCIYNVVSIILL